MNVSLKFYGLLAGCLIMSFSLHAAENGKPVQTQFDRETDAKIARAAQAAAAENDMDLQQDKRKEKSSIPSQQVLSKIPVALLYDELFTYVETNNKVKLESFLQAHSARFETGELDINWKKISRLESEKTCMYYEYVDTAYTTAKSKRFEEIAALLQKYGAEPNMNLSKRLVKNKHRS
jgi:hypothetical protein